VVDDARDGFDGYARVAGDVPDGYSHGCFPGIMTSLSQIGLNGKRRRILTPVSIIINHVNMRVS
jgi:hypothetical protein